MTKKLKKFANGTLNPATDGGSISQIPPDQEKDDAETMQKLDTFIDNMEEHKSSEQTTGKTIRDR